MDKNGRITTLFDTEQVKYTKEKTAIETLRDELKKSLSTSIYKYKIHYNRVFYGLVGSFPKGVTYEDWCREAESVWNSKKIKLWDAKERVHKLTYLKDVTKLLDVKKANQK